MSLTLAVSREGSAGNPGSVHCRRPRKPRITHPNQISLGAPAQTSWRLPFLFARKISRDKVRDATSLDLL